MELYLAVLGLILSFFFAGSEAAFTTFNRLRLEVWKKRKRRLIKNATIFVKSPENFFSTILIGNNFANILYTTFATVILIGYMEESFSWIIITIIVLFIGEILPKSIFRSLADRIILQTLIITRLFYVILKPVIAVINFLIEIILKILKIEPQSFSAYFSREEMELLLSTGYNTPSDEGYEQLYIKRVLDFSASKVREAMIPRTDIIAASVSADWDTIQDLMIENRKMRIPVFEKDIDSIVGVVFLYDMIQQKNTDLNVIIKQVPFVPENKNCLELMREFQEKNISTAIVLDEYGGTAGLVTMDDLIEEVFGEFQQTGEISPQIKALNNFTWLIDGNVELDELIDLLDLEFEKTESETLAGYILEKLGRIPKSDETTLFEKFRVEIIEASEKRIEKVKIILDRPVLK